MSQVTMVTDYGMVMAFTKDTATTMAMADTALMDGVIIISTIQMTDQGYGVRGAGCGARGLKRNTSQILNLGL